MFSIDDSFHPISPFLIFSIRQKASLCKTSCLLVFSGGENMRTFLWICSTYDTGVFWERKWEGLFVEFLWAPKREYERPADLNPFLSGQAFAILVYVYWNNVLLMIMGLNWRYESRFDVITSNQSYWNYHGFLSAWGDLPAWGN